MRKLTGLAMCVSILAATPLADASAGPMALTATAAISSSAPVEKVWYRRGYRRGWGYRPRAALAAGAAVGAGLAMAGGGYGYYGGYYPYYGYDYGYGYGWDAPAPVVYAPVYYGYAPGWGWGW